MSRSSRGTQTRPTSAICVRGLPAVLPAAVGRWHARPRERTAEGSTGSATAMASLVSILDETRLGSSTSYSADLLFTITVGIELVMR
jgi:hypothetical protein